MVCPYVFTRSKLRSPYSLRTICRCTWITRVLVILASSHSTIVLCDSSFHGFLSSRHSVLRQVLGWFNFKLGAKNEKWISFISVLNWHLLPLKIEINKSPSDANVKFINFNETLMKGRETLAVIPGWARKYSLIGLYRDKSNVSHALHYQRIFYASIDS